MIHTVVLAVLDGLRVVRESLTEFPNNAEVLRRCAERLVTEAAQLRQLADELDPPAVKPDSHGLYGSDVPVPRSQQSEMNL